MLLLGALIVPSAAFARGSGGGSVHVRGYYRSNGTYVPPHYRSAPDRDPGNNWSTKGNVNPYTGQEGTKSGSPAAFGSPPLTGASVITDQGTTVTDAPGQAVTPSGAPSPSQPPDGGTTTPNVERDQVQPAPRQPLSGGQTGPTQANPTAATERALPQKADSQESAIVEGVRARQQRNLQVCRIIQQLGHDIDNLTKYDATRIIREEIPEFSELDFERIAVQFKIIRCFEPHTRMLDNCSMGDLLRFRPEGRCKLP